MNNGGYLELDEKYKKLSITKNIKFNKINDEYTVCFWFYQGITSLSWLIIAPFS